MFTLLPKPRNSVIVGQNKNKVFEKQTNRVLVPHTLTKKKDVVKTDIVCKQIVNKPLVSEEKSDDDDDEGYLDVGMSANFFSLGEAAASSNTSEASEYKQTELIEINDHNNKIEQPKKVQSESQERFTLNNPRENFSVATTTTYSSTTKTNSYFSNILKSTGTSENKKPGTSIVKTASDTSNKLKAGNVSHINTKNPIKKPAISPYGDVTAPYGDVTSPYGGSSFKGVTTPYGEVTAPYGDVTAPYGDVTAPYGDVTAPYGNGNESGISTNNANPYPSSQPFFSYAYHSTGHIAEQEPEV